MKGRVGGEGTQGVGAEAEREGERKGKGEYAGGRTISTPETEGGVRGGGAQLEKAKGEFGRNYCSD